MSVIFHFSRQFPKSSLRKNWLEIQWPIFLSHLICFPEESHTRTRIANIYIWIFLSIDFAPYVLTVLIKESKVKKKALFSLFRFLSRREIEKLLHTAVLGWIYLKSRLNIKDIPKLAGFNDSFFKTMQQLFFSEYRHSKLNFVTIKFERDKFSVIYV